MASVILFRIYGTVESLARSIDVAKRTVTENKALSSELMQNLTEQDKVLQHMRQIANKLQLEIARQDEQAVSRSLKIFYSLHHMLRPEVAATTKELGDFENKLFAKYNSITLH